MHRASSSRPPPELRWEASKDFPGPAGTQPEAQTREPIIHKHFCRATACSTCWGYVSIQRTRDPLLTQPTFHHTGKHTQHMERMTDSHGRADGDKCYGNNT